MKAAFLCIPLALLSACAAVSPEDARRYTIAGPQLPTLTYDTGKSTRQNLLNAAGPVLTWGLDKFLSGKGVVVTAEK